MNNIIDLQILTQVHFDSGSLSGLGSVVHRLDQVGEHQLTVLQGEKAIQTMPIRVRQLAAGVEAGAEAARRTELHVNLGDIVGPVGRLAPRPPEQPLEVGAKGYALFHAPPNSAGFAVQLRAPGAEDKPATFDSRRLGSADAYATVLLRPGRYSITNSATGAKGEVKVSYPVIGEEPYRPPDPFEVQVTGRGFQPASIQLKPAQGLIFRIGDTQARIVIDLVEPDDGPGGARPAGAPLHRWERPMPPENR